MKSLFMALLLVFGSVAAQEADAPYRFVLNFDDGSVEVCQAHGFSIDGVNVTVQVQACNPDTIFKNGFE